MHAPAVGGRLWQQIRIGAEPWLRERVGRSAQRAKRRVHARLPAEAQVSHGREQRRPAPRRRPRRERVQRVRPPRARARPARRLRSERRRRSLPRNAPRQGRKQQRRSRQPRQRRRNLWRRHQNQPCPQRRNRHRGLWPSLRRPRLHGLPLPWVEAGCRNVLQARPRRGHPREAARQAQVQARTRRLIGRLGRQTTTISKREGRVGVPPALPHCLSVSPTRPPRPSRSMPSSQCSASVG